MLHEKKTSKTQNFNFNTSSCKSEHPRAWFILNSPIQAFQVQLVQVFYRHYSELSKYVNQTSEIFTDAILTDCFVPITNVQSFSKNNNMEDRKIQDNPRA